MKKFLLAAVALLGTVLSNAQNRYAAFTIPAALLQNANAVTRVEEERYEIVNLHRALYTYKVAYTILNEEGQSHAEFVVPYDRLQKVLDISGTLYDAMGKELKKVRARDIRDVSAISDISLFEDNRMKIHDFGYKQFPYTVEYEVMTEYNHTFYMPGWVPQSSEGLSVESSHYTFVAPADYALRYKAFNYRGQPVVYTDKGKTGTMWTVQNLPAVHRPFASPRWRELTTTVVFAPSAFEMEGYTGNATNWTEFGKFILSLSKGRDALPPTVVQKVASLTAGITDPKEKVAKLYQYLQENTRYISIQLGIGGFQPFEAGFVAEKGYGDCKALSNYMYSLLKAAGIRSHHALINAGRNADAKQLLEDLPSTQFNHMVLFVPLAKDTVWLECTSQDELPGYSGGFTGNRTALAITEEGGKLVKSPRYTAADNLQVRVMKGTIDEEGNLVLTTNTKYAALQQDNLSGMLSALSKDKVKKVLNEELDLPTYEINNFSYAAKKEGRPEVNEALSISVANYATVSGRRLFVTPNVMNKSSLKLTLDTTRKVDYVFDFPYTDVDSVQITVPDGYAPESVPGETVLKTKFGNYTAGTKLDGVKLIYYRKMERLDGRYSAADGAALVKFYNDVYKADRAKVVLVKKENQQTSNKAVF